MLPEKMSIDDALAHHGIKGMKWGVRRGGLGSRAKGALADRNQRTVAVLTRMKENRAKGLDEHLGRALTRVTHPTKKGFNKVIDKTIAKRNASTKRIESGHLAARDILSIAGHVSATDLFISRRDNKG